MLTAIAGVIKYYIACQLSFFIKKCLAIVTAFILIGLLTIGKTQQIFYGV
jgi:hypothetical protein